VPEENLFPVPDGADLMHAAMAEPCAVALHGVRKMKIEGNETAAVFGGGPIGLMCAQWLRLSGCGHVIVVEIDDRKLATAKSLGFTCVNPESGDSVKTILDLTGGCGASKVIEACGLP